MTPTMNMRAMRKALNKLCNSHPPRNPTQRLRRDAARLELLRSLGTKR